MISFSARTALELTMQIAKLAEQQAREFRFAGEHGWDIDSLPGGDTKAYKRPRNPREIDLIVVHVTAVKGGFGVQRYGKNGWLRWRDDGLIPIPLKRQISAMGLFSTSTEEQLAKRLALWSRYRYTPYHQIASQNGDVIANRRVEQRSWHGNDGGNDGVGLAIDCGHNEELIPWLVDTGRAALRALIVRLRDENNDQTIRVVAHRCYSASRRNDPDRMVWGEIVKPVVLSMPGVMIDYEERRGSGRPIPLSWDENATHDDHGKRLCPVTV